jgi:outer membrane usher protein
MTFMIDLRTRPLRSIFLNLALASLMVFGGTAYAQDALLNELVLEVRVNQQDLEEMLVVLRDSEGTFWIDQNDFERLRLRVPAGKTLQQNGRSYVALNGIAGVHIQFDESLAMLIVEAPARAFLAQSFAAPTTVVGTPRATSTGYFGNYQISGQRVASATTGGALIELGMFSRVGVLTNTTAARYDVGTHNTRLETTLVHDFPDSLRTLTIGDTLSDPGGWGTSLRFAGVRFARNFGIRPDLITTPLLTTTGSALVPSAVDVFVNNQHVLTQDVQPGPFSVDNLPSVTGAGDVRIVVRDALGREQILTQSFYASPTLLARNLNQYSFSIGKVRERYALSSFDYGGLLSSANFRRGMNDYLTLEGHAEYLQNQGQAAGIATNLRVGHLGVASATLAMGGDATGNGWLGGLGFERRGAIASFGLSTTYASDGFRRAGDFESAATRQKFRVIAQAGLSLGKGGSLALAIAHRTFRDITAEQTLTLGHTLRVGNTGSLNLSVSRESGARSATSGFLTYSTALGPRRRFATSAETGTGNAGNEVRATLQQSAPMGIGSGWRLGATRTGNYDATWQQHFPKLDVELQAARNFGQSGQSVQLRGGATWLDTTFRAARAIDGSFAVVDVAGVANVPVYVENQLVTHTDAKGRALLHNLLSYEPNRITIAPEDLPLDTAIESRTLVVQPAYRSGVVARFPVARISPATFHLVQPDGTPVPAGAQVHLNGGTFAVALEGLTYVTTLDHGVGGSAQWGNHRCAFRVEPPPSNDPLPEMGTIVCRPQNGSSR